MVFYFGNNLLNPFGFVKKETARTCLGGPDKFCPFIGDGICWSVPFFGAGGLNDTGYALIPDGSGSLMTFNKEVKNLSQYIGYIYNRDITASAENTSWQ